MEDKIKLIAEKYAKQLIKENNLECEIHFDTETCKIRTIGTRVAIMCSITLILETCLTKVI